VSHFFHVFLSKKWDTLGSRIVILFDFLGKFRFVNEFFLIFYQNLDFWANFWISNKISNVVQNFEFWRKCQFLTKISIFDQNFDFWPKFRFLTKISISDRNFDFWPNIKFLLSKNIFGAKKVISGDLPTGPVWHRVSWVYY